MTQVRDGPCADRHARPADPATAKSADVPFDAVYSRLKAMAGRRLRVVGTGATIACAGTLASEDVHTLRGATN
jgi:hypothetical protein